MNAVTCNIPAHLFDSYQGRKVIVRSDNPNELVIDVMVRNPAAEYPLLYHFSRLLDKHPVRISIPVKTGFVKAVRLAVALGFSVKLEVDQPDVCLIAEMAEVLDLYLHRSEVSQPVEYFHSTFLSFFNHQQSPNLWFVQEEAGSHLNKTECDGCEFFETCGGYFKWPNREFNCEGVKILFSRLNLAAEELRYDLASFQELPGGLPA